VILCSATDPTIRRWICTAKLHLPNGGVWSFIETGQWPLQSRDSKNGHLFFSTICGHFEKATRAVKIDKGRTRHKYHYIL
jgi:hypothetical protein